MNLSLLRCNCGPRRFTIKVQSGAWHSWGKYPGVLFLGPILITW